MFSKISIHFFIYLPFNLSINVISINLLTPVIIQIQATRYQSTIHPSYMPYCCLIDHPSIWSSPFHLSALPSIHLFTICPSIRHQSNNLIPRSFSPVHASLETTWELPSSTSQHLFLFLKQIHRPIDLPNQREVLHQPSYREGCLPNSSQMLSFSSSVGCSNVSLQ